MEFEFHIQDPLDPTTKYLYEAIVEQLTFAEVNLWRGLYSFATGDGVRSLFMEDPHVRDYISRSPADIIIGIDAVTNPSALEQLAQLDMTIDTFHARVFKSRAGALFHPKVSSFHRSDGLVTVVIGSGNLTPGGLRANTEAFSVITGTNEEMASLSIWDTFVQRHAERIGPIDEDAIERARENERVRARRLDRAEDIEEEPEEPNNGLEGAERPVYRVLVAEVPKGGDRWHQIHFNADVVEQFIRMRPNSEQRAFLRSVSPDGRLGPEEQRPLVYSTVNRNYKIEMSARRDHPYPHQGTPLLVMKEIGARTFRYMILFPGEDGYLELRRFIDDRPSVGRGHHRVISTDRELKKAWPALPL